METQVDCDTIMVVMLSRVYKTGIFPYTKFIIILRAGPQSRYEIGMAASKE